MKRTYTHKGWFFVCPVYLNPDDGDGMDVTARSPLLEWWFDLNVDIFNFTSSFSKHDEPFPFKVTGRLETPVVFEVDE